MGLCGGSWTVGVITFSDCPLITMSSIHTEEGVHGAYTAEFQHFLVPEIPKLTGYGRGTLLAGQLAVSKHSSRQASKLCHNEAQEQFRWRTSRRVRGDCSHSRRRWRWLRNGYRHPVRYGTRGMPIDQVERPLVGANHIA